jgi:hypothetical protein
MTEDMLAIFIPIIAIVMGIGLGMIGVVSRHRQLLQRAEMHHKERLVAMEKGLELPPEPLDPGISKPRHLLKGLVYTGVGISLFVALRAVAGEDVSLFALIPFAVGIAYLLYYWVRGRHEEDSPTLAASQDVSNR